MNICNIDFQLYLTCRPQIKEYRLEYFYLVLKYRRATSNLIDNAKRNDYLMDSIFCDILQSLLHSNSNIKRCLKITEKVSFNIASEASYVYIFNGQKLIKNAKNGPFWRVFENLKLAVLDNYNGMTQQRLNDDST